MLNINLSFGCVNVSVSELMYSAVFSISEKKEGVFFFLRSQQVGSNGIHIVHKKIKKRLISKGLLEIVD